VKRLLDGQVAQINQSNIASFAIRAPSSMEVQQIRGLVSRQKRLLLPPINIGLTWQQDSQGRSQFCPGADSRFVLML
jgi:hypothetical protein